MEVRPLLLDYYWLALKMKSLVTLFVFSWFAVIAQLREYIYTDSTGTRILQGTLLFPDGKQANVPLVIIIAGSGPTDRNGNSPQFRSDYLKLLAEGLTQHGIATFRYDKRGVGKSKAKTNRPDTLVIEDFSADAIDWIRIFKSDKRFRKIIVLGHSEGSLVGMLAARSAKADGFISLAGAGRAVDEIIKEQIRSNPFNPEQLVKDNEVILDSLKAGHRVVKVNPLLTPLYRPLLQPYLISWLKYDPAVVFRSLKIPCMIVQGTTDVQISVKDAERLKEARPDARYVCIDGMNHVLRDAPEERTANLAVYFKPEMALSVSLIPQLVSFILSIK
jgi:hypothetical protein